MLKEAPLRCHDRLKWQSAFDWFKALKLKLGLDNWILVIKCLEGDIKEMVEVREGLFGVLIGWIDWFGQKLFGLCGDPGTDPKSPHSDYYNFTSSTPADLL